jgi:hypothetical protein
MAEKIEYEVLPSPEPYTFEVEKGQKNTYSWAIRAKGSDPKKMVEEIKRIDGLLRAQFKIAEEPKEQ